MGKQQAHAQAGFSLLELMVALSVTMIVSGLAVGLLTSAVNIRAREDRKSDAISDVRRTIAVMTREIVSAGYGISETNPTNGIVAADSNNTTIRLLSNGDRYTPGAAEATPNSPSSPDEDVIYQFVNDAAAQQRYIVRYDVNATVNQTTVLANRIDALLIRYYPQKVVYTPNINTCDIDNVRAAVGGAAVAEVGPAQATYIVITACVTLPAVGSRGSASYQPPTVQQLTSDVQLRNVAASSY